MLTWAHAQLFESLCLHVYLGVTSIDEVTCVFYAVQGHFADRYRYSGVPA